MDEKFHEWTDTGPRGCGKKRKPGGVEQATAEMLSASTLATPKAETPLRAQAQALDEAIEALHNATDNGAGDAVTLSAEHALVLLNHLKFRGRGGDAQATGNAPSA